MKDNESDIDIAKRKKFTFHDRHSSVPRAAKGKGALKVYPNLFIQNDWEANAPPDLSPSYMKSDYDDTVEKLAEERNSNSFWSKYDAQKRKLENYKSIV